MAFDPWNFDDSEDEDYEGYGEETPYFISRALPDTTIEFKSVLRETDKAWLIEKFDGSTTWYPKSKCYLNMDRYTIWIPGWLVGRKQREAEDIESLNKVGAI